MTWGAEIAAEVARALADLAGAGLPGDGDETNAELVRIEPGTYDPDTGTATPTVTVWPCVAVPVEAMQPPLDATSVSRVLRRAVVTLEAGVTPQEEDRLNVGSASYRVTSVQAPTVTGTVASWVLGLAV